MGTITVGTEGSTDVELWRAGLRDDAVQGRLFAALTIHMLTAERT